MKTEEERSFKYALINNHTNQYYLGTSRENRADNFGPPSIYDPVFTYTKKGAHAKLARFPDFFEGCKVVRFIP
jgi:hypothetical protein